MKQTKKIGLTGVMGAGKSSVIALLKQQHIAVLDCDEINQRLLQKGNRGYMAIVDTFTEQLLDNDGNLDKQKLSDLIFSDPKKKQRAEKLLHPLIQQEIKTYCETCSDPLVFIEVPLLFEVRWEAYFDEVWVVACDQELLLERLAEYRKVERTEAFRRMKFQLSQEEKCAKADVILYNNDSMKMLNQQLLKELQRIMEG